MAYKSKYTGAQIDEAVEKTLSASGGGGGTQLYKHKIHIDDDSASQYGVNCFVLSSDNIEYDLVTFEGAIDNLLFVSAYIDVLDVPNNTVNIYVVNEMSYNARGLSVNYIDGAYEQNSVQLSYNINIYDTVTPL